MAPARQTLRENTRGELALDRQPSPASCNIEVVNDNVTERKPIEVSSASMAISGWVLPERTHKRAANVRLRFIDTTGSGWESKVAQWSGRPDVFAAMKVAPIGDVGFHAKVDAGSLKAGIYRIVLVFDDGDISAVCDKQVSVVIQ